MKNNMYALTIAALALATSPLSALAASGTGTSTATIVTPITITPVLPLAFGKLSALTGGTVTVDATTAARSVASGAVVLVNTGSTTTAATFDIAGEGSSTYTITLPASPINITRITGTETMAVGTFTSNPSATGTLTAGAQTISVGGTLTVGSGQVAGDYTGTFSVTVEYN